MLPGLDFFTDHNKTYGVRNFILYTIYIVGDQYLCRGHYYSTKIMVAYALQY